LGFFSLDAFLAFLGMPPNPMTSGCRTPAFAPQFKGGFEYRAEFAQIPARSDLLPTN
jgi:hypothetical protein